MVTYPLPEGFSDFDVFSLGSCLLVEGKQNLFQVKKRERIACKSYYVDV